MKKKYFVFKEKSFTFVKEITTKKNLPYEKKKYITGKIFL
jgi:hypothetical protein